MIYREIRLKFGYNKACKENDMRRIGHTMNVILLKRNEVIGKF